MPIAIYSSAQNSTKTGKIFVQNVHFLNELASYIVACQAHHALVKVGLILAHIFYFNGLLVRTFKGLTAHVLSGPGAKAVFQRPLPTGTRQYTQ